MNLNTNYQINFQIPATPIMEGIVDLHHNIFFYVIIIFVFVMCAFRQILKLFYVDFVFIDKAIQLIKRNNYIAYYKVTHWTWLEIIWTLIPSIILMLIAIPSFMLLYSIDEVISPIVTLKVIGAQWYWIYEYSDYENSINYESILVSQSDAFNLNKLNLLDVKMGDEVILPTKTHIRILTTAEDVIHSWTVPSFGVKMDAVPGRLNQISLFIKREGIYYGQCSELCGKSHAWMPIKVCAVEVPQYISWIKSKLS